MFRRRLVALLAPLITASSVAAALRIVPEHACVHPGGRRSFAAYVDENGTSRRVSDCTWSTTAGVVDDRGRLRAREKEGLATVHATRGDEVATAFVRIAPPDREAARVVLRPDSLRCTVGSTASFAFELLDGWGRALPTRCVWQPGPGLEALAPGVFRPVKSGRLRLRALDPYSGLSATAELWVSPPAETERSEGFVVRSWTWEQKADGELGYEIHLEATAPDAVWFQLWHVVQDRLAYRSALSRCGPGRPAVFRGIVNGRRVDGLEVRLLDGHERPIGRHRRLAPFATP